jgi:hypothetical protein
MKKSSKKKPMTEEQKRIARNEYSRKWKKEHKAKVAKWNKDWHMAQKKKKSKKKAAKKVVEVAA